MFKELGNLASMLKQAQKIGGRMQELTEELKSKRVEGSAGGGMVVVEVSGTGEMLGCRIEQELVEQQDRELMEDLVTTAVNQALQKARELHAEAMQGLAGGIPGFGDALSKLSGNSGAGPAGGAP